MGEVMVVNFRFIFVFAYLFLIFNISSVIGVGSANAIEKSFFLLAGVIYVSSRNVYWPTIFVMVFLLSLTFFSALLSENEGFEWGVYLRSITQILIIFMLFSGIPNEQDKKFITRSVAWFPIICVLLGVFYHIIGVKPFFNMEYASGLPRLGGSLIPPYLGAMCVGSIISALFYADTYNKKNYLYIAALNIVILLATSARMPLVVAVILTAVAFYGGFKNKIRIKLFVTILGILFLIVFLLLFGDLILTRITQTHMSGREIIWEYLLYLLDYYYDFGVGYGHQVLFMPHEVTMLTGGTVGAHNEYLRVAVEIGFWPAVLFFISFFIGIVFLAFSPVCERRGLVLLAGVLYMVTFITDNSLSSPTLFLFMIVLVITSMKSKEAITEVVGNA
jgi:hypothetical protein